MLQPATQDLIQSLYIVYFQRPADPAGLLYWGQQYEQGMELSTILQAFITSDESDSRYGLSEQNPAETINRAYISLFGRTADSAGLEFYTLAVIEGRVSLGEILLEILNGSQNGDAVIIANKVQAANQFTLLIDPELDGQNLQLTYGPGQIDFAREWLDAISSTDSLPSIENIQVTLIANMARPGDPLFPTVPEEPGTPDETPTTPDTPVQPTVPTLPPVVTPEPPVTEPVDWLYLPMAGASAGISDASTAIALDDQFMVVGDDEANLLRIFPRIGGEAVLEWDFSAHLGITNGELDLEASTQIGNILYFIGSHSNKRGGNPDPDREFLFAVEVSGTGADTQFAFLGSTSRLEQDLLSWDSQNLHGLGTNYFNFVGAAASGVQPEQVNGFSIEGMTHSPDFESLWIGFRAPQTPDGLALLMSLTLSNDLLSGNTEPALFGDAIQLNLGGRGIRSIEKAKDDSGYLILAGPASASSNDVSHNFRLYTWSGDKLDSPIELENDLDGLLQITQGSFESIVEVPSILPGTSIQLLQDNGDTIWLGKTQESKRLPVEEQQFMGNLITLSNPTNDQNPPMLVRVSESFNQESSAIEGPYHLIFNEGIARGTGQIRLLDSEGTLIESLNVANPQQVKIEFNQVTFLFKDPLNYSTSYQLEIDATALLDHSGNAFNGFNEEESFVFQTAPEPEIISYSLLITEVNSNGTGGDFFELYNYGDESIDLSGWRMNDDQATFDGSKSTLISEHTNLAPGATLTVVLVQEEADFNNFLNLWNLTLSDQFIFINGPGLGKGDAVVIFNAEGQVATSVNYGAATLTASDGTVISPTLASEGITPNWGEHTGSSYGGHARSSMVWDGLSTSAPTFRVAVDGELGGFAQVGDLDTIGSPGTVFDLLL